LRWVPRSANLKSVRRLERARALAEIQIRSSQPFKRTEVQNQAKLDAEEALVTALLAVGMVVLAAVTIMIFF